MFSVRTIDDLCSDKVDDEDGVPACDVVYIYCSVVRSVLKYACAVWHPGLSNKLSKDIKRIQKHCTACNSTIG